ncbi:Ubiquitin-related domain,Zinc finger C2H2-type,UBX domain,Ubiquitin-associated domain,UBA-like [Cinara cedri]|uniref:Ubiquitin-related domain,Zinc finger C2H2-type,UBX domain,Ubiquitin-associated domain,UBA-like n=1 Tax=Cinara cedri TaxID=506608 RepID=A0A5E4N9U7_9HEMI|nr:Ubiquitin-related domain,Zinc finger C2H2-type,UBX domain,Ubiquitin-associated domain,UBA-like [Cinara cedri]
MSQETIQTLVDMGFQREKVEKSVLMTGNQGVEQAMEWLVLIYTFISTYFIRLLAHHDEMEPSTSQGGSSVFNTLPETNISSVSPVVAKSYKCEDCNKLFTDTTALEYHAMKTNHSNFSESTEEKKPLTEEEKKEQMRKLEDRLREKRKERENKEKEEELEREKIRIRSGKELSAAKKKLEDENIKKIMDERKREKQEEKVARDRVKAQIEADKLARKKLFSQVSGEEQLKQVTPVALSPQKPLKDYTETKLQIRLTNGQSIIQAFNVKEMLAAVRVYIELNRSDGDAPFSLMTSFPRKVFTNEDYEKPLEQLGLVPSAVIILTKPVQ